MRATDDSSLRLAEVVASLSLIIDLGLGQPLEHALRSSVIAVRLGEALGLSDRELSDTYYVTLLRFLGCTAAAHEMADVFGDEVAARGWLTPVFTGRLDEMPRAVQVNAGAGLPTEEREQTIAKVLAGLPGLHGTGAAQCEVAQLLADRLGLGESVRTALGQVFERWDGYGVPRGIKGEAIVPSVQVAQLAQNAEAFSRRGVIDEAIAVITSRADSAHSPVLVERFAQAAPRILADLDEAGNWERAIAAEPGRPLLLRGSQIDRAASAFADFADLKSHDTLGHSRGVARLAARAAALAGLAGTDVVTVERAGLVHDVGRVGITVSIWAKPGPLTASEWERVRMHPYYTDRALARSGLLSRVGAVASLHHERLDGSGYHRGLAAAQIPPMARLLASADAFHAMTEPRSHRPALSLDYAASELRREVRAGRLDADAVNAVLAAAGQGRSTGRRARVAGLTEREVEVLRLLARGLSDRQIADRLTVSTHTAHHHVEHIYTKLGVTTRAAATLLAMQHDLLGDVVEGDEEMG